MGQELRVSSFVVPDFHETVIVDKGEDYVIRYLTTSTYHDPYLDHRPILATNFETFVVQDLGMLSKNQLAKIFHYIKRKTSTFSIIHDSEPSSDPALYQFK